MPYWKDPRIHNLGNQGLGGAIHALFAPVATKIIDNTAYKGRNVREELLDKYVHWDASVVDLCCGVGFSTRALGVDASPQMIRMARVRSHNNESLTFEVGNAETFGETKRYDVATLMFALHEMPRKGRRAVISNAQRISQKVVVVDIAPHYRPSSVMLSGEPFVTEYLQNVCDEIGAPAEITAGTVAVWILDSHDMM